MNDPKQPHERPLCVDLDGTLIRSDMLFESVLELIRKQPICVLYLPFWIYRGKAYLKSQIASRVDFSDARLLFNDEVLDFVRSEKKTRKTVLVTGSHASIAKAVFEQTEAFNEYHGSTNSLNLVGKNKQSFLNDNYGKQEYDYIGNDTSDVHIWEDAASALIVSEKNGLSKIAPFEFEKVFTTHSSTVLDFISMLRIHQWSKNLLIFVPLVLDQKLDNPKYVLLSILGFFAISLLASMTYIINDLLDLQADRQNVTKSKRALASGRVPIKTGILVIPLLIFAVLVLCTFMPTEFNLILLAYLLLTLSYSFYWKSKAQADVLCLAALHTIRVIAGMVILGSSWSFWPLAFSMFIFLSLALSKRCAELINIKKSGGEKTISRGYQVADLTVLTTSGIATGYLSVLVVALYINSDKIKLMYTAPIFIWLICPVIMYWISRIWLITNRGNMHEDPIVFALRDRTSWIVAMVLAALVYLGATV